MLKDDITYKVFIPDSEPDYIFQRGYHRLVELYGYYGDLKVDICRSDNKKFLYQYKILVTTSLSAMVDPNDVKGEIGTRKYIHKLSPIERHILHTLSDDPEECIGYDYLENEKFKRPELKVAMARLRYLGFVDYCRGLLDEDGKAAGSGFCQSSIGQQVVNELELW